MYTIIMFMILKTYMNTQITFITVNNLFINQISFKYIVKYSKSKFNQKRVIILFSILKIYWENRMQISVITKVVLHSQNLFIQFNNILQDSNNHTDRYKTPTHYHLHRQINLYEKQSSFQEWIEDNFSQIPLGTRTPHKY